MNTLEGWKLAPIDPTPEMIAAMPFPTNVTPAIGVTCYQAMLNAAPPAPAARQPHSFSSIDCEALIAAVLPGGSICDPQQVADSIRSYLNAWPPAPAAQSAQTDPGAQEVR